MNSDKIRDNVNTAFGAIGIVLEGILLVLLSPFILLGWALKKASPKFAEKCRKDQDNLSDS